MGSWRPRINCCTHLGVYELLATHVSNQMYSCCTHFTQGHIDRIVHRFQLKVKREPTALFQDFQLFQCVVTLFLCKNITCTCVL